MRHHDPPADTTQGSAAPGGTPLVLESPLYPAVLRHITDPPATLWVRGELPQGPAIAVVGSRECSTYGRRIAYRLARDIVRAGFVVVSGLARGVDAAAHCGALDADGPTIAVLPTGIDRVYPRQHVRLAARIARGGAVVTEFPPGTLVNPGSFHQRNRIIAGLAAATVVVEAAQRSGAKITARFALDYDREVLVVPGRVDSPTSVGTLELLLEGAAPCTGIATLLNQLPETVREAARPLAANASPGDVVAADLDADARAVLSAVPGAGPCGVEQLIGATRLPVGRLLGALTDLQVHGLIRSVGNQQYERV